MEHGNSKAKSTAKGPISVLAAIENDLLRFIFKLSEQGFDVIFLQLSFKLLDVQVPMKIKLGKVSK